MQKILDYLLHLKPFEGHRTQIINALFIALAAYKAAVAAHVLPNVIQPEWENALIALLAGQGLVFAAEHKEPK